MVQFNHAEKRKQEETGPLWIPVEEKANRWLRRISRLGIEYLLGLYTPITHLETIDLFEVSYVVGNKD